MSLSPACFTPGPEHTYSDRSRRPRGTLKCNLTLCSIFPAFTLVHSLQKKKNLPWPVPTSHPPPSPHPSLHNSQGNQFANLIIVPLSPPIYCIQGKMPKAEPASKVPTVNSGLPSSPAPPSPYSPRLTPLQFWKVLLLATPPPSQGPHTCLSPLSSLSCPEKHPFLTPAPPSARPGFYGSLSQHSLL